MPSASQPTTAVLGAGITGLTLALRLAQRGERVLLVESSPALGGQLATQRLGDVDIDRYYHFLCLGDQPLLDFLAELGLAHQVSWRSAHTGMFSLGQLHPLTSLAEVLRAGELGTLDRLRLLAGLSGWLLPRDWRPLDRVPALDWLRGYVGDAATAAMWEPLLRKKFGPHHRDVSAAWLWARTRRRLRSRHWPLGPEILGYLRQGFAPVLATLEARLEELGVSIRHSWPVDRLERKTDGTFRLHGPAGCMSVEQVASTLPLPILRDLARELLPADYVRRLDSQQYLDVRCLTLLLDRPLSDAYWINVLDDELPFVGVVEFSQLRPAATFGDNHLVYLPAYLPVAHGLAQADDSTFEEACIRGLRRVHPHLRRRWIRHSVVSGDRHVQPVCFPLHGARRLPFQTPVPGLFVAEASMVYPEDRGVSNSVRLAAEAAGAMCR